MLGPPINFQKFVQENEPLLKPPVNNRCIYRTKDFTVMVVGGPNVRRDYHINATEEWFYQTKGDMVLKVVDDGEFKDIPIKEGEMFMLPGNVPHSPQRFADTIGIVIEVKRPQDTLDTLRWYCEKCSAIVYQDSFYCVDLGTQLKPVIEDYFGDDQKRTCKVCGHVNPKA